MRIMKEFCRSMVFVVCFTVFLTCTVQAGASQMTRGMVTKVDSNQVLIAVPNDGERSFEVTQITSVIRAGKVIPIKKLRINTLVQLTSVNREAHQILVVEVPK